MNERGRADERLHEVRAEGVFEQRRRRALRVDISRGHGLVVIGAGDDNAGDARLEIRNGGSETKRRHDFAGRRDVKPIFARRAVGLAAQTVENIAQLTVIHIHAALPSHAARIDVAGIALLNAVVYHRGDQVVRRRDGVHVAREMQIDVLHRHDLRIAAARRAALHAENRAERRFAKRETRVVSLQPQSVGQSDGNGRLAFASRGRIDGCDQHKPAFLRTILQSKVIHLCLIAAVRFQQIGRKAERIGDFFNGLHHAGLRNFNIGQHEHPPSSERKWDDD